MNGNGDGKGKFLVNGTTILDTLLEKQQEILEKQGEILGAIDSLGKKEKENSRETRMIKRQIARHIEDHHSNPEFMAVLPFARKYSRKHWKVIFAVFFLALLVNVGVGVKQMFAYILGK